MKKILAPNNHKQIWRELSDLGLRIERIAQWIRQYEADHDPAEIAERQRIERAWEELIRA